MVFATGGLSNFIGDARYVIRSEFVYVRAETELPMLALAAEKQAADLIDKG